jgi:hypothetical protein
MSEANGAAIPWPKTEANVLGSLLLGEPYAEVASFLGPQHFTVPAAALIYRAIAALASTGTVTDPFTVSELLSQLGHTQATGGIETLSKLARDTIVQKNFVTHARVVRDHADCRRLQQLAQSATGTELLESVQRVMTARAPLDAREAPPTPPIELRHVADIVAERRETEWLNGLHKILERRVIAILGGVRDTFKSFVGTHWCMVAAVSGESVVMLSGEGGGLGRRIEAWLQEFAPAKNLRDLKLLALERALRLNAAEVMAALSAAIDAAGVVPTLILIDTLSKFTPGMKENASEDVAAFLHLLSSALRERYGCTTLLVAHAGHGDAKRPRGSSVLMANPDAEYMAEKPDPKERTVLVSRDRFKDSPALPPLAYTAKVVDLGRLDAYGEPVTSLVLWEADSGHVIASKPALQGAAQRKLLAALQERSPDGSKVWSLEDIRSIGRELNLPRSSARYAANYLTTSGHLEAAGPGWKLKS